MKKKESVRRKLDNPLGHQRRKFQRGLRLVRSGRGDDGLVGFGVGGGSGATSDTKGRKGRG